MKSRNIILIIFCTLLSTSLYAQKLTMGYLFPAGGEVGTTVEIIAGGLNIDKATKVMFSHPGIKGELIPFKEKASEKRKRRRLDDTSSPQLADRIKIKISIASNVPCGIYDLRLQGKKGVSNMLPFEVASYPNIMESKKSTMERPDKVNMLPAVLCGYVTPGGIDYFRFSGRKGENIVVSVKARQLVPYIADAVPGWFQPVIKIVDSKGKEVAYSDDYHHYVDPVIMTTLPKDDKYTLMIHDAIYRGREDFNYRIHIGTIPFVTGRYPAYGVVGKRLKQEIEGVNLGSSKAVAKVKAKKEGYNQLTYTNKVGTSNAVSFYALPKGSKLIQFPKNDIELDYSAAISDSLTADAKIKRYTIFAEKREKVIVELIGRRNGSRLDAVLRLKTKSGRVIKTSDDTEDPIQGLMTFHADPVLRYTARKSEELILEVEDLHRGYGKDYHYLLRRHRQLPAFNAFVSPANISIPSGGTAMFKVDVTGNVKKPAEFIINGLPKGYTTSNLKFRRGKKWEVSITSPKGAEVKRFPISVKLEYPTREGKARADVLPVDDMMQAFYYTHHIPAAELALDVTEPSPYRMSLGFDIKNDITFTAQDDVIPIKVILDKNADFTEPVELMLGRKSGIFSLEPTSIMPDEKEKMIEISINKTALAKSQSRKYKPSFWQMHIVGTVKGEVIQRGRRRFRNAKYSEMTPIFGIKLQK